MSIMRSSIAIMSDNPSDLEAIDELLVDDSILDDMVLSLDFISELERDDTYIYRCETDDNTWVNIYEVQKRLEGKVSDIIYAITDSKTYVEVISTSGLFDSYVDSDLDKIESICEAYGLEFFGSIHDEEDDYVEDEVDDWN